MERELMMFDGDGGEFGAEVGICFFLVEMDVVQCGVSTLVSKVRIFRESLGGGVEGSGLWMREGEVR